MWKQRLSTHLAAAVLLALCALALTAVTRVQAGPPAPIDIPLTQPDGSQLVVRQWGNEWQHGFQTLDGYTLILDEASGFYVYAQRQVDGTLAPAQVDGRPLVPGRDDPQGLEPFARPDAPTEPQRAPLNPQLDNPDLLTLDPAPPQSSGDRPMLVILAQFNDRAGISSVTAYRDLFFGSSNSVHDYYQQASYGKLNFTQASETSGTTNDGIVGWVNLGINHPSPDYYSASFNADLSEASLNISRLALQKANGYVNFASYDTDGDGYVTAKELQVVIIAAGFETSYNPTDSPSIWGHQWNLDSWRLQLDGKYVGSNNPDDGDYGGYSIFGERQGNHIATIGIMVHEIGHLLGWPDLYDTDSVNWEGTGSWSVMSNGSWNGVWYAGDSPALPDAWSKWYQGWISPTPANSSVAATSIGSSSTTPTVLLVGSNPNGVDWSFERRSGTGEYWLVEKRQFESYDAALPGCGLLIWHIDETAPSSNSANSNPARPLVALEQADGRGELNTYNPGYRNLGDSGDPYPGTSGALSFNNNTVPNSRYNSGISSMQSVTFETTASSWECTDPISMYYQNGLGYSLYLPTARGRSSIAGSPSAVESLTPGEVQASGKLPRLMPVSADLKGDAASATLADQKYYLPVIFAGTQYATGIVRSNGVPLAGTQVQVMYSTNNGSSFSAYGDPALTNASGVYFLRLPPLIAAGTQYRVSWTNQTGNSGRLARFDCTARTVSAASHTCDFDVLGVSLLSPALNASVDPPVLFEWARRPFNTDSYAWQLYKTNLDPWGFTTPLGYTDRFTLTGSTIAQFGSVTTNVTYYWSVRVNTPSGVGIAFERRAFKFSALSSPPRLQEAAPGVDIILLDQ